MYNRNLDEIYFSFRNRNDANAMRILFFIFSLLPITGFSQSLFFDELNTTTWTSAATFSEADFEQKKEIPLSKLTMPQEKIDKDVSIWTFKDDVLTIVYFNATEQKTRLVGVFPFEVIDQNILQIQLKDGSNCNYKVGIVSTGNYAYLYPTKKQI
jgi:hypothetical protein